MSRLITHPLENVAPRLNAMLAECGQPPLFAEAGSQCEAYHAVLRRWNAQINLTAIRNEDDVLRRHFVESITVARALPASIQKLLDFGSGAGFPGLPIAICRPEISVTLAESQGKKAAFLREAVRSIGIAAEVYGHRAETIGRLFDCVTLRAVDGMQEAAKVAASLVVPGGWLALLTTDSGSSELVAGIGRRFTWRDPILLPSAEARILLLGRWG